VDDVAVTVDLEVLRRELWTERGGRSGDTVRRRLTPGEWSALRAMLADSDEFMAAPCAAAPFGFQLEMTIMRASPFPADYLPGAALAEHEFDPLFRSDRNFGRLRFHGIKARPWRYFDP
jgi:hypothetical protein